MAWVDEGVAARRGLAGGPFAIGSGSAPWPEAEVTWPGGAAAFGEAGGERPSADSFQGCSAQVDSSALSARPWRWRGN